MSNVKIQMSNQAQNPNIKITINTQVLTFSHLDFIWHLSRLGGMKFKLLLLINHKTAFFRYEYLKLIYQQIITLDNKVSFFETNKNITRREFLQKSTVVGASFILSEKSKIMKNSPNILWIMTDDQRVDSLHCYGSSWAKSLNVDALAASGVLFRNAISQSPVCAPSRTSMLSGKYCCSVGLMANRGKVKEGTYPLTRKFSENGYQLTNIGKLGSSMTDYKIFDNTIDSPGYGGPAASPFELIDEFKGKEKEFDVIKLPDFVIISGTYPLPEERTEHAITITNAIDFIENRLREPFFLRVSMISPHTPVMPPKPYDTMFDPDEIPLPLPTEEELKSKPEFERIKQ